jgi:hypothetical protein
MQERDDTISDVNLSSSGIDDMIKMSNLSEEAILKNLKIRYQKNAIYVPPPTPSASCCSVAMAHLSIVLFFFSSSSRPTRAPFWCRSIPTRNSPSTVRKW